MGQVFLARDRQLHREVAVKLMGADQTPHSRKRFLREAASLAKLKHPNVVQVFSHGLLPQGPYIVMEYLQGAPLDKPPKGIEPLKVMLQVAAGLDAIHGAGLVHRDLKLPNIMLTEAGRAVIVDFGLVRDTAATRVTKDGAFVGTFMVGAPEVLRLSPATSETDWYAWGLNLYVLCEGNFPFPFPVLMGVTKGKPLPQPSFERLTPGGKVAGLIRRCLAEDPARRPSSEAEVRRLLEEDVGKETLDSGDVAASLSLPAARLGSEPRPGAASEAVPPLSMAGPRSSGAAAPLPRSLRAGAVAGVGLGLVVAVVGLRHGLQETQPSAEPPQDAGPPPPTLPADYAEAVGAELTRVAEQSPGLLDPDPTRWGALLTQLSELARFRGWVSEGGDPSELAPGLRDGLREVGTRYRQRGLPDPLFPMLQAAPAPATVRRPPLFRLRSLAQLELPQEASGWLGACLDALGRAAASQIVCDRQLKTPAAPPPPGFPPDLWARRRQLSSGGILDFVRHRSDDPEFRLAVQPWLAPGARQLRESMHAAARSIRQEPATRDALASVFFGLQTSVSALCYTHFSFEEPDVLLAGPPRSAAGWALRAAYLGIATQVRKRMAGAPVAGLERARLTALGRAIEPSPEQSLPARTRAGLALLMLVKNAHGRRDGARLGELYERYETRAAATPGDVGVAVLTALARASLDPEVDFLGAADDRRLLADVLERRLSAEPAEAFGWARDLVNDLKSSARGS